MATTLPAAKAERVLRTAIGTLLRDVEGNPVAAIQAYWLAMADLDILVTPHGVAEVIVDHQCARGDYAGCSSELEMAYTEYVGWATEALGAA